MLIDKTEKRFQSTAADRLIACLLTVGAHMVCLVDTAVAERRAIYSFLKDRIFHALCCVGNSSTKEPVNFPRSDEKRLDGLNFTPWSAGKMISEMWHSLALYSHITLKFYIGHCWLRSWTSLSMQSKRKNTALSLEVIPSSQLRWKQWNQLAKKHNFFAGVWPLSFGYHR